jgi:hypothetical protein
LLHLTSGLFLSVPRFEQRWRKKAEKGSGKRGEGPEREKERERERSDSKTIYTSKQKEKKRKRTLQLVTAEGAAKEGERGSFHESVKSRDH